MSFVIKSIALIGLMLTNVSAQAEVLPDNPYLPKTLDQREYMGARLQVGQVCQDLSFYLRKHPNPEMQGYMSECTPDMMEYRALVQCEEMEVEISYCPVIDLMRAYSEVLAAYMQ